MALRNLPTHKQSRIWTPTLTDVSNLDTIVLAAAFYSIAGDLVTCWLHATPDPTAGSAYTFRVSLPIGVDIVSIDDVIGVAIAAQVVGVGDVEGVVATDDALVTASAGVSTAHVLRATFAYRIP